MSGNNEESSVRRVEKLRELKEEIRQLSEIATDLTSEVATTSTQILKEVKQMPLNDASIQENLLGADVINDVGQFIAQKVPKLETVNMYTLDYYVMKLKERVDRDGWQETGRLFDFLRASVSFQVLNQRTDPAEMNLKTKERKQTARILDNRINTQATLLQETSSASQRADGQSLHAQHVLRTLRKLYKDGTTIIGLWPFILNPNSFEHTIENMFSVNILVNDRKIKLIHDPNSKEHFLQITSNAEREQPRSADAKVQTFMSVSPSDYSDLLIKLKIRKPMITPLETDPED